MKQKTTSSCGRELAEFFIARSEDQNDRYWTEQEICTMFGLNALFSKDKQKLMQMIKVARDHLYTHGFILANRRTKGWKVAVLYEAVDEKEKACNRVLKQIVGIQKRHLNKKLSIIDVLSDPSRALQHEAVVEFADKLQQSIDDLNEILSKSPYRDSAKAELIDPNEKLL